MARTSRVARRSTGPFPELLQLAKKAQNRAASRSRFTQLRVRQQSISVASSTVSRSTTPDFESDNEAEEATASPPPRKRARVAQKRVLKEKACPASASTPRTRSSTEVADGSDVLRQRLKETEQKLTQAQELLQETQKTLQDKESELTVAKDMLASLGQENAKLRNIAKIYERRIGAERTNRERARRKQARIEWQLKKYTDDCDVRAVNSILDAEFQEDELDEALNALRDYIADARMVMSKEDYRAFREEEESARKRKEGRAYAFRATETDDEYDDLAFA